MPIVRRKLDPNTVYPETLRYDPDTDTVQSLVNGDWVDNPQADPRTQTTFPPRITSNTECDAGESVKDAFSGQIANILTAIDNASTAFTIAGLILGIFTFGVFGVFIGLALGVADTMLSAGTTALSAALTEPVYHQFACIIRCHMDTNGRVKPGEFSQIVDDVNSEIGGLAATILNNMLQIAGEGGVNNLASLGMSTGDCDDCGCVERWCYEFDFTLSDGGWSGPYGVWAAGGWQGTAAGTGVSIVLDMAITSTAFTHVEIDCTFAGSGNIAVVINGVATVDEINVVSGTYEWDGTITDDEIILNPSSGAVQGGNVTMTRVLFKGTGTNPFGADNCTP